MPVLCQNASRLAVISVHLVFDVGNDGAYASGQLLLDSAAGASTGEVPALPKPLLPVLNRTAQVTHVADSDFVACMTYPDCYLQLKCLA